MLHPRCGRAHRCGMPDIPSEPDVPSMPLPPFMSRSRPTAPGSTKSKTCVALAKAARATPSTRVPVPRRSRTWCVDGPAHDDNDDFGARMSCCELGRGALDHVEGSFEVDPEKLVYDRMLAVGDTADIFAGELDGRTVAIKAYRDARRLSLRDQICFLREVDTFEALEHPNLVRLIGACTLSPSLRIVTELCAGGSLYELLYERCEVELSWSQKRNVAADISTGMAYLHGMDPQIIHRDLTSFNCLLDARLAGPGGTAVAKVGNFGFARTKNREEGRTKMTTDVGTLVWVAPEILMNEDYDEKVDVYSFGIIVFELIFRQPPFEELDLCSLQNAVTSGVRPDTTSVPDGCPADFLSAMELCWSQDPCTRPNFHDVF